MHTGQIIQTLRTSQGISQKELAKRLKIRVKTLKTIESIPYHTKSAINRLALALGIEPEIITDFEAE